MNQQKIFFKEEDNGYLELIGSKISKYLGIRSVHYDLAQFNFSDKFVNGVISKDFREKGYKIVNFATIIDDYIDNNKEENIVNEMNLEFIWKILNYRYKGYNNSQMIVAKIMDELVNYFLLDILIGNYDNGKYNYEIMENESAANVLPEPVGNDIEYNFSSILMSFTLLLNSTYACWRILLMPSSLKFLFSL